METEALTADEFNSVVSAVTNAFGDPTRREIYLFARDAGAAGVTAGAVAEQFELHPNVARHHLEKLTGGGYLVVEVGASAAVDGAGPRRGSSVEALPRRSARRHARAPPQARRPPRRSAGAGARRARARSRPRRSPTRSASSTARRSPTRMDPTEGHRSVRAALTRRGRRAHRARLRRAHRSRATAASPSCRSAARSARPRSTYPHVVCALDRGMIRGMLAGLYGETSPQFETSRPDGGDHCVARV